MEYEKYQSRVDKGRKNMKRSDKDNAALAKAEQELYHASEVTHLPRPPPERATSFRRRAGERKLFFEYSTTTANGHVVGVQRCR